jgi:hypothetical protein
MTQWAEVKKLKAACHDQWREAKGRLDAMGIGLTPWPGVGIVPVDVSELEVDAQRPAVLRRALKRFLPTALVQCNMHVEAYPLFKAHELAAGNYEDRKLLNPEETVREWVKRITNVIIQECDHALTDNYLLRVEPTVGFPKGDDFGNWMILLMLGAPSPYSSRLEDDAVAAAVKKLSLP